MSKACDALPSGGALIVYESIIDDDRSKNAFGLMMSLNMLIETPGGFDYTGADCCGWMKEAGFSSTSRRAARRPRLDGGWDQVGPREAEVIRAQRQRAPRIRSSGPVTFNVPASSTIYLDLERNKPVRPDHPEAQNDVESLRDSAI